MNNKKYVYLFKEGNETMRNLLGGKGANLAEMTILGIPVPQGFIVTTEACNKYYNDGKVISEEVLEQIQNNQTGFFPPEMNEDSDQAGKEDDDKEKEKDIDNDDEKEIEENLTDENSKSDID